MVISKKKKIIIVLMGFVFLNTLFAGGGRARGTVEPGDIGVTAQERASLARQEGEFIVYTSQNSPFMEDLTNSFNASNPGITMRYFRGPSSDVLARLQAEQAAGMQTVDVFIAWWDTVGQVIEAGLSVPYLPPNADQYSVRCRYGNWVALAAYANVIGYNTNNVRPEDVPRRFMDLTSPRWNGRVGLADPRIGGGAYAYYFPIWQLHGRAFFDGVGRNNPMISRQHTVLLNAVAAGQIDISIMGESNWVELINAGAPLATVHPEEGVVLTHWIYAVMGNSRNPNAVRHFIDWLASRDGQVAVTRATNPLYALLGGVPSPEGLGDLSRLRAIPIDFDAFFAQQEYITNAAAAALGLGVD
jgi:iron(III) transport system substrate-binding protein